MSNEPSWLAAARQHLGVAEIPGKATAPIIARWLRELRAAWNSDDVPWCGTFVAAVLRDATVPLPAAWYRARAWLDWGTPIASPVPGCIVVYERAGGGHVGFVVGRDAQGRVMTLGGNQGDRVSIAPFEPSRVLGYRWPTSHLASLNATGPLPLLASNGAPSSIREA